MQVEIFTMPSCDWSNKLKSWLDGHSISYEDHDVSKDTQAVQRVNSLTGKYDVPVLVADDNVLIGFSEEKLQEIFSIK